MIEIDHTLLTTVALDNLLIDIITRQATDYGEFEVNLENKKKQLLQKLETREIIIVYCSEEGFCDIITAKTLR